jgi:hypothetical protein
MPKTFTPKPLGLILQEAGLITPSQIEVALQDQQYYQLPFGEILSLHGWIHQQTADFFAESWPTLFVASYLYPLGYYLKSAALLTDQQIELILEEQKKLGIRFGAIAVLKGWVNQQTVDYFLENLLADAKAASNFQSKKTSPKKSPTPAKNTMPNGLLSKEQKELILPSSQKRSMDLNEFNLFISEPTIFIDGNLVAFASQGENPEEIYDLAQSLDYHLVYSE